MSLRIGDTVQYHLPEYDGVVHVSKVIAAIGEPASPAIITADFHIGRESWMPGEYPGIKLLDKEIQRKILGNQFLELQKVVKWEGTLKELQKECTRLDGQVKLRKKKVTDELVLLRTGRIELAEINREIAAKKAKLVAAKRLSDLFAELTTCLGAFK